jgi:hypothetical protein
MRKITLTVATLALLTVGCASNNDYKLYADTQRAIAQAHRDTDIARYQALSKIAETGDSASKVAAVMSLNMGAGNTSPRIQPVNPPKSIAETALQWTSVLLPSLTQVYGISANRQIAITQSNNQAAVAKSTNDTFAAMNGNMATSNTAIANSGLTSATTIANSGLTAATTIANSGLTSVTSVANTGMNNLSGLGIKIVETIPLLQPNVTTTTTNANPVTTTTNNTTAP